MRTGLAGLVALVWSIAAILIGTGVGGPPPLACVPTPPPGAGADHASLVEDPGPQGRSTEPDGPVTTCNP